MFGGVVRVDVLERVGVFYVSVCVSKINGLVVLLLLNTR